MIEADRRQKGYTTSCGTESRNKRQPTEENTNSCQICYKSHATEKCTSACNKCGKTGHKHEECTNPQKQQSERGRSTHKGQQNKDARSKSCNKSKGRKAGSPYPQDKKKHKKPSGNKRTNSQDSEASGTGASGSESEGNQDSNKEDHRKPRRNKNNCIVLQAPNKTNRVGGRPNPTLSFQVSVHRRPDCREDGRTNPRLETCIPDTGCTASCISKSIPLSHRLQINPLDKDELKMTSFDGSELNIIGQTKMHLRVKGSRSTKMIHTLIVEVAHDREILLSWVDCLAWGIITPQFPMPMNTPGDNKDSPNSIRRTSSGTSGNTIQEVVDSSRPRNPQSLDKQDQKEAAKLKQHFLKKYPDVFRDHLEKGDVIKCEKIHIETKEDSNVKLQNCRVPATVPLHLRSAATKDFRNLVKSSVLEPCTHHTNWVSRGLFVLKNMEEEEGEPKVRLVTDFSQVNKILKCSNYPNEGSAQLLKQINPNNRVFVTLDFSSRYYQVYLPEEYRDSFAILLPQGKFQFARLPQGSSPAGDIFNIVTDEDLRDLEDVHKNMDDLMATAKNFDDIKNILDQNLQTCRRKNIKLNKKKFNIGTSVIFGGAKVEYVKREDRIQISPKDEKIEELLGHEAPKTKKQCQSLLGSLNQLANWIPNIKLHIPGIRKLSGSNTLFTWNSELDQEFETMKKYVKKNVPLTPFDMKKPIHRHTDVSMSGMGYVLSQPRSKEVTENEDHYRTERNLITLGSCGLSQTQTRYSTIEQEMLAIKWAIEKTDFFVRSSKAILVFCDNKNISDIFKMDLSDMKNNRLLKMIEKLVSYPIYLPLHAIAGSCGERFIALQIWR